MFFIDDIEITEGTLESERVSFNNVNLYPNPVASLLTIESDITINNVSILNNIGIVVSESNGVFANTCLVDVNYLPKGIYYIEITTDKGNEVKTFVKK